MFKDESIEGLELLYISLFQNEPKRNPTTSSTTELHPPSFMFRWKNIRHQVVAAKEFI